MRLAISSIRMSILNDGESLCYECVQQDGEIGHETACGVEVETLKFKASFLGDEWMTVDDKSKYVTYLNNPMSAS